MDFGKISDPHQFSQVDFSLPAIPARTLDLLTKIPPSQPQRMYVGCPIWNNPTWKGRLYPPKTPTHKFLFHYSRAFPTIELNTTFYQAPNEDRWQKWSEQAADHFLFCPKVPRTISHDRMLLHADLEVEGFCTPLQVLGAQLGPCFLQLPPQFSPTLLSRLDTFLGDWPQEVPLAIEFRHEAWFYAQQLLPEACEVLEKHQVATVITDVAGRRDVSHMNLTQNMLMLRFVGNGLHSTDYTRLEAWIERIAELWKHGLETAYIFIHEPDTNAQAPELAIHLLQRLNEVLELGLAVPTLHLENGGQMSLFDGF